MAARTTTRSTTYVREMRRQGLQVYEGATSPPPQPPRWPRTGPIMVRNLHRQIVDRGELIRRTAAAADVQSAVFGETRTYSLHQFVLIPDVNRG